MLLDPARLVRLSYDLAEDTPSFGNNVPLTFSPMKRIRAGDACNSHFVDGPLHAGTHLDAPRHFSDEMPSLTDLPISAFCFQRPVLVDVPKTSGELIVPADLKPHSAAIEGADFLAVRTGYASNRSIDPERFGKRGPGFHSESARYLLDTARELKGLGMDTVSAASFLHIEEGIEFHRRMLGRHRGDRFVLLIEDMNLAAFTSALQEVWVVPLFVRGGDGAPCTVFGVRA